MDIRRIKFKVGDDTLFVAKYNNTVLFHFGDQNAPEFALYFHDDDSCDFQTSRHLTAQYITSEAWEIMHGTEGEYEEKQLPCSIHKEQRGDLRHEFMLFVVDDNRLCIVVNSMKTVLTQNEHNQYKVEVGESVSCGVGEAIFKDQTADMTVHGDYIFTESGVKPVSSAHKKEVLKT